MSRQLKAYVHVVDRDSNQPVVLGPGDDVPSWAEKQITNPKAWADADADSASSAPVGRAPRKAAAKRAPRGKAATRPDPKPPADQAEAESSGGKADGKSDGAGAGDSGGDGGSQ